MTEAEWWAGESYIEVGHWLFNVQAPAERKSRLFALACCRVVQQHLADWPCAAFVNLVEQLADGNLAVELIPARIDSDLFEWDGTRPVCREPSPSDPIICRGPIPSDQADWMLQEAFSESALVVPFHASSALRVAAFEREEAFIPFLHDIFGPLPFRDMAIEPAWRTSTVTALARGIYDEKAFDRMPILADALQDAGCNNDELLAHCREPNGEHVRGCWVVDLILGKPWREPT
jgi:hypothetical protein